MRKSVKSSCQVRKLERLTVAERAAIRAQAARIRKHGGAPCAAAARLHARSKRSSSITLAQAATKSATNLACASALA